MRQNLNSLIRTNIIFILSGVLMFVNKSFIVSIIIAILGFIQYILVLSHIIAILNTLKISNSNNIDKINLKEEFSYLSGDILNVNKTDEFALSILLNIGLNIEMICFYINKIGLFTNYSFKTYMIMTILGLIHAIYFSYTIKLIFKIDDSITEIKKKYRD